MAIRIGIAGVTGRMGQLLVEEARFAGAELVGGVGRAGSGKAAPEGVTLLPDITALAAASDVVIDFTNAATARPYAAAMVASGKAWGLGTSGCARQTSRRWRLRPNASPSCTLPTSRHASTSCWR
jgi:4-hydroxy-tetrahydrodipicolinate reductase